MRIVFTGDISFSKYMCDGWKNEGTVSSEVAAFLHRADHVIANVESPLTDRKINSNRVLNHASDPAAGTYLAKLNMKLWSLANNHITDCGADGLADTLRIAGENDCRTLGAGMDLNDASAPVYLKEDVTVGVLSVSKLWKHICAADGKPGAFTWNQESLLRDRISEMRTQADYVVLVVHGENEYNNLPMPYTRERYHRYLNWGADLIVAHHPHVVQNYEVVGEKAIFYSLGNFIFDTENQRLFDHTDCGILLGVDFSPSGMTFDHLALQIDRDAHRVVPGETPAVFCDIPSDDYRRLWPLEAARFYPIDKKRRMIVKKRLASMSKFRQWLHEMKMLRQRESRTILLGRVLYYFGAWKHSAMQNVVQYLLG